MLDRAAELGEEVDVAPVLLAGEVEVDRGAGEVGELAVGEGGGDWADEGGGAAARNTFITASCAFGANLEL
jgi:hypothetical protein